MKPVKWEKKYCKDGYCYIEFSRYCEYAGQWVVSVQVEHNGHASFGDCDYYDEPTDEQVKEHYENWRNEYGR